MSKRGRGSEFWKPHIDALMLQGISDRQYGAEHGLSVYALGWWRRKLRGPVARSLVAAKAPKRSAFVAVRVGDAKAKVCVSAPVLMSMPTSRSTVRLTFSGTASMEFAGLPSAQWLAQFARALHEVR